MDATRAQEYIKPIIENLQSRNEVVFVRALKTAERTGKGLSTLWRDVADGNFVPPVPIGKRSVAWVEREVDAFLEATIFCHRHGLEIPANTLVQLIVNARFGTEEKRK